ncbi:hypothetical protein [Massilia sp. Root335]|uniref:hypothetical protein n=1 Tax=Massilia sp. Root335 TaxID=1736517 RepID=UPI001910ABFA|nr:hypothetical protein [Massilia sp. Root335]
MPNISSSNSMPGHPAPAETADGTAAVHTHKVRRVDEVPAIASPAAAGPAGSLLEGHVGAQYLLPLLSGGEARGLPGVVVTHVEFQRAGFDHQMDDVVVTGYDPKGEIATLELQAKRTITFTASDKVFADVVALACRVAAKPEFESTRYLVAVAISRTSTKVEHYIQDVLKWARDYQSHEEFFRRLNQSGAAHQSMRDFVEAFRSHMRTAGATHDDLAVWRLLSRFLVLPFDFEQPGSVCAQLARERCALLLPAHDTGRAGELWDTLQQVALQVDAAGGDLDAPALRERLTSERGYRLAADRRLQGARGRLAEASEHALDDIDSRINGVTIDRSGRVAEALSALDHGRYLEILGAGGVGKSGILKDLAQRVGLESRVIVVAPNRIPGGGWAALQAQLGCDASAQEFLLDLAGDGGGTLFVDGLDRFDDDAQMATVTDLIRAAAKVRDFRVVVTARLDFDTDARAWLPSKALLELGRAPSLIIGELEDDEIAQLRDADPALAALLVPGHPAQRLVHNLYRLNRLASGTPPEAEVTFSEAQMAWQWWTTGDGAKRGARLERRRLLRSIAMHSLESSAPLDAGHLSPDAITGLIESGSLRALDAVRVELAHDVLRDWAIGCILYEERELVQALSLQVPAPVRTVRGVELAARLHAEIELDAAGWQDLLEKVSVTGTHGSWKRAVLLALARSERASEILDRCLPVLSTNDAAPLCELVRAAVAVDSQPAAPIWAALGADTSELTDNIVLPRGPTWFNLTLWSLAVGERLPSPSVPHFVDLYFRVCNALVGKGKLPPLLVARLYAWLIEVESEKYPRAFKHSAIRAVEHGRGLSMTTAQENQLRTAFLLWCKLRPLDTQAYLERIATHPHRETLFRQLVSFIGSAAYGAPQATADLFLKILPEGDDEDDGYQSSALDMFSNWDSQYFPASPARPPFLDLLQANKEQGLRLVRGVVAHAIRRCSRGREPGDDHVEIPFPDGARSFPWRITYMWSRSQDSDIVASALMALEGWAHIRVEAGEPVEAVIGDVLGPDGSPAAFLLVAVDVLLSHWPKTRVSVPPFAASAQLLAMDRQRWAFDAIQPDADSDDWVHPEPFGAIKLDDLRRRPSRGNPLDALLFEFGAYGPDDVRADMQRTLAREAERLGMLDEQSHGLTDPKFAAVSALHQLDPANYKHRVDPAGRRVVEYQPPVDETKLLAALQQQAQRGSAEIEIRVQLAHALTEQRCPVSLIEQGLKWATVTDPTLRLDLDKDELEWIGRTQLIVAALVLRDGSAELKARWSHWAQAKLMEAAVQAPENIGAPGHLPYNSLAIAAVGFLAACRDEADAPDLRPLLRLSAESNTNMASVLRTELNAQRYVAPTLARSLVRLGFAAAIYAIPRRGDDFSDIDQYQASRLVQDKQRKEDEQSRLRDAVEAELRWLAGDGDEPVWPELPPASPPRQRNTLSWRERPPQRAVPQRAFALNAAEAAQWLSLAENLWGVERPELLRSLVRHCWLWTATANGVGCAPDEQPGELSYKWNDAYFSAALAAGVSIGNAGIREYVLGPLTQLPEERFLDAAEAVLHALDRHWFNGNDVLDDLAISTREALLEQLRVTSSWKRLASERTATIEIRLAGAVAAMFMGQYHRGSGPRCYVPARGATRADAVLPMLMSLVGEAAGSTFVAVAFVEVLEIAPHVGRLSFLVRAISAWWTAQGPNSEFWTDHGIGRRICAWIESAVFGAAVSPAEHESVELIAVVDILVQCGIPSARGLEERLFRH